MSISSFVAKAGKMVLCEARPLPISAILPFRGLCLFGSAALSRRPQLDNVALIAVSGENQKKRGDFLLTRGDAYRRPAQTPRAPVAIRKSPRSG